MAKYYKTLYGRKINLNKFTRFIREHINTVKRIIEDYKDWNFFTANRVEAAYAYSLARSEALRPTMQWDQYRTSLRAVGLRWQKGKFKVEETFAGDYAVRMDMLERFRQQLGLNIHWHKTGQLVDIVRYMFDQQHKKKGI